MKEELIDSYFDVKGAKGEADAVIVEMQRVHKYLLEIKKVELKFGNISGSKELKSVTADFVAAQQKLEQSTERLLVVGEALSKSTIAQSEARKRSKQAIEEEAKAEVELSEATRKRNASLKTAVQLEQANANSIDQARAKLAQLRAERNKLDLSTSAGQNQKADLNSQIDVLDEFIKKNVDAFTKQKLNIGNYSGALKTLEGALDDVRKRMDDYAKSGKTTEGVIEALTKEEMLLSALVNNQVNGFASATAELKNNEKALQALAAAGLQNEDVYKSLLKETAELKDNVGDLKASIAGLASDTSTLDGLISGAELLAGTYSVATGAAELFGLSQDDLQEAQKKFQAVTEVLNGLQAVQNALQKESSFMLLVNSARTKGLAAAQTLYAFATGGATVATKALRVALLATGIGAIVVLLAAAAEAMGLFSDETDDARLTVDGLANSLSSLDKQTDSTIKGLNQTQKIVIEYAKQRGASEKEIQDLVIGGLEQERRAYLKLTDDKIKKTNEFLKTVGSSTITTVGDAQQALDKLSFRKDFGEFDKLDDSVKKQVDATIDAYKDIIATSENASDKLADIQLSDAQFATQQKDKAREKAKKDAEDRLQRQKEYARRERAAQFEILKLEIDDVIAAEQAKTDNLLLSLDERVQARMNIYEEELSKSEAQKQFELSAEKVTEKEKELIRKQAANRKIELDKQTATDILKIQLDAKTREREQAATLLSERDEFVNQQNNTEITKQQKLTDKRLQSVIDGNFKEQEANLAAYKAGEISKEQYELNRLKIENDGRRKSLELEIGHQQKILSLMTLTPVQVEAAEKQLQALKNQLRQEDLKNEEAAAERSKEIHQQKNEKLKELASELSSAIFGFAQDDITNEKNAIQDLIDDLDLKKAKDIDVSQQTITNTQERANAIAEIEASAAAKKEVLEIKKRKLDVERWKAERAQNIANIIQSTSLAVVSALGAKPFTPANLGFAAVVGGIGLVQLTRALATTPPRAFKTGKNRYDRYEGIGIVGDGGKEELIVRGDGSGIELTPKVPTLTTIKADDIILPDASKVFEMGNAEIKKTLVYSGLNESSALDTAKLIAGINEGLKRVERGVVRAIDNIPQPIIKTENKIDKWVRGNSSWESLNRY